MDYKVLGKNILVTPLEPEGERKKGGIILPSTMDSSVIKGKVLGFGNKLNTFSTDLRLSDVIFFNKNTSIKLPTDEGEYYVLKIKDVISIVQN
jgi:co-chaperonin GroES (HSP10)